MERAAGFSPAQRLRKSGEFIAIRRSGKKLNSQHFSVFYLQRPDGLSRLGLTVSRKIGCSVKRNRVKRLLRELFRRSQINSIIIDLSIIAKPGAADLTYDQVYEELTPLLTTIGSRGL